MRQIPVGWNWKSGSPPSLGWAAVLRERDMADNFDWIVQQLRPKERVLVFAALAHIAAAPIQYKQGPPAISFGVYLKHRYRDQVLTIGTLFGGGAIAGCRATPRIPLTDAPPSTVSGLMGQLGVPLFALDLRAAPPPVASWLSDVRNIWDGEIDRVRISDAMDVIVFIRSLSPACK
jgi:erythromycin esterase-like protein